jgi:Zn-dependent peptidase ImmA (M78 family)
VTTPVLRPPLPEHFRQPGELLKELGIFSPEDIQIEGIAQHCGATILYEEMEGADARIVGYGERAYITVNSISPVPRQRFSAAHELGHWMWDRGKMAFVCDGKQLDSQWGEESGEKRANRYAVELLLPSSMFARKMEEGALSFRAVQQMSQDFQTSLTATAIRLVELTAFPAILISSEGDRRRWYFRSPHVPRFIKPKANIPPGSLAHRLLAGETPAAPQPVEANIWIDSEDLPLGVVHEDTIRMAGEYSLTMLWWPEGTRFSD